MSTHYSGSLWWQTLDSPHDQCGHGTSMAGLAAAPWSNDGNAVGAAYKANLLTIRAVEDVLINTSNERMAYEMPYISLAIIAMSKSSACQ